jgi:Leucine-rich repeat (LRR) protein
MSHNELNRISIHITSMTELKALILNHNKIKTIDNLASLTNLNTIGTYFAICQMHAVSTFT